MIHGSYRMFTILPGRVPIPHEGMGCAVAAAGGMSTVPPQLC